MKNNVATAVGRFLVVFAFVFAVMLLVSKDSYMHDLSNHYDSAWFFMCGKAWVNGLVPYVDFTDSKGPLLWAVYALGYVISPYSYIGVFWLSCLAWTVTLLLAWRSAVVLLENERSAFVAMTAVALAGLLPHVHNETRCEDFAMPFVAFVVYALCCAMWRREWSWTLGVGIGVSVAATALMKYNITVMLMPFVLLAWVTAWRRCGETVSRLCMQGAVGALAVALPFFVCFMIEGNLLAFVNEYLFVTLHTTGNTGVVDNTLRSLLSPAGVCVVGVFVVSAWAMVRLMPCYKKAALVCNVLFFTVCAINSRSYYFTIYSPFAVFAGVALVGAYSAFFTRRSVALLSVLTVAALLVGSNLYSHDLRNVDNGDFFTQNNAIRREFYAMECMVAQVPEARMVCVTGANVGVCSGALPACKYWATQWGSTSEMDRQQIDACVSGRADFAVVPSAPECRHIVDEIKRAGWHVYDFSDGPMSYILMSRKLLDVRRDACRMSNVDVLLKRRPQFCR